MKTPKNLYFVRIHVLLPICNTNFGMEITDTCGHVTEGWKISESLPDLKTRDLRNRKFLFLALW